MNQRESQSDPRLSAYLDGDMSPQESAAFEKELESDDSLRREVELQRRIDAALTDHFTPDEASPPPISLEAADLTKRRGVSRSLRSYAAAAVLALAAIGGWFAWSQWQIATSHVYGPTEFAKDLDRLYQTHRKANFDPKWICADDEQFFEYSKEQLGRPLLAQAPPEGVHITGWDRGVPAIGPATQQILVRFDDDDDGAVILIDRINRDRAIALPERSRLHLFKRTLDDLVLYEITPRSAPTALELFYEPPFDESDQSDAAG